MAGEATGGEAKIIELEGTTGADPAIDRKKGFEDYLAGTFQGTPTPEGAFPGMEIIASQTGDFQRDNGREVMQTLLQAHPDVTAVYAHNDEMAIGAIAALEEAGRKPGEDVIIVSIDGENAALDAILDGTLGASVESSPFFGPIAFETMAQVHRRRGYPGLGQGRGPLLRQEQCRGVPGQAVLGLALALTPCPLSRRSRERGAWRTRTFRQASSSHRTWSPSAWPNQQDSPEPLLVMEGIEKAFPGVVALDGASLRVARAKCTRSSGRTAPARAR